MKVHVEPAPLAGGGELMRIDVRATDADLKALTEDGIILIDAPGADLFIDVLGAVVITNIVEPYDEITADDAPRIRVGPSTGSLSANWDEESYYHGYASGINNGNSPFPSGVGGRNQPLKIYAVGTLTGGHADNTAFFRIYARVEPAIAPPESD